MINQALWQAMKNNTQGYFALTADEKECLDVALKSGMVIEAGIFDNEWRVAIRLDSGCVHRIAPDALFPEELAARESVPDGWTFVGHGRETQATDTDYIARFVGVWVTNEQWSGCCSAAIYAVRNDAPDEIWQRFGIEKNPHRKEPEFEVLDVVKTGVMYCVDSHAAILTSSIIGLHSVRYEDADGNDYGWMCCLPPCVNLKTHKLLIPKQVRIQKEVR